MLVQIVSSRGSLTTHLLEPFYISSKKSTCAAPDALASKFCLAPQHLLGNILIKNNISTLRTNTLIKNNRFKTAADLIITNISRNKTIIEKYFMWHVLDSMLDKHKSALIRSDAE